MRGVHCSNSKRKHRTYTQPLGPNLHGEQASDSDKYMGQVGSVAETIMKRCKRPLAVVRPLLKP